MNIQAMKEAFEGNAPGGNGALLRFAGVDGYDVYNCSIPFAEAGQWYIYGRVERRGEWANSHVRLFRRTGPDLYALAEDVPAYALEDPFVQWIGGELVLGGTHVRKTADGAVATYWCDFYRGADTRGLSLFATGPDHMKDVRLVPLSSGAVGVFSRPRDERGASIGYTEIPSLDALNASAIAGAKTIEGLLEDGAWGGCNQCYPLADGRIGVIGHLSYTDEARGGLLVYTNAAFLFSPKTHAASAPRIIATRGSYPAYPAKKPRLADCAFPSGIVPRPDGYVDLFSGLGDTAQGRVTIDNPFGETILWTGAE